MTAKGVIDDLGSSAAGANIDGTVFRFDDIGKTERAERGEKWMACGESVVEISYEDNTIALFVDCGKEVNESGVELLSRVGFLNATGA